MNTIKTDITVIGGGPAGLAAALKAKELGAERVLLLERDTELGGILQQCIHDGFGLHRFKKRMSGNQYAQAFIDEMETSGIEVKLDTMVLEVTPEKVVYACNKVDGMLEIQSGAVILAMGCRERTASQVMIFGERPAGIMTAGAVQFHINKNGYLPGTRAVILGSGDIGLIMARRMTLEGIEVKAVYEVMPSPGGLTRNIVQCLDDFGIPLNLSTTVTSVHGRKRVESVTVAKVDENMKPIPGTEEDIPCDLLVLAVGLIPENELSRGAGIELDPKTKGPLLDNAFQTSVPGIFAAGNVAVVFDLVDYVSDSGEIAASGAVDYINGRLPEMCEYRAVETAGNVNFVVPQRLRADCEGASFFMRVKAPAAKAVLTVTSAQCKPTDNLYAASHFAQCAENGDAQRAPLLEKRCVHVAPPEMLAFFVEDTGAGALSVSVENGEASR